MPGLRSAEGKGRLADIKQPEAAASPRMHADATSAVVDKCAGSRAASLPAPPGGARSRDRPSRKQAVPPGIRGSLGDRQAAGRRGGALGEPADAAGGLKCPRQAGRLGEAAGAGGARRPSGAAAVGRHLQRRLPDGVHGLCGPPADTSPQSAEGRVGGSGLPAPRAFSQARPVHSRPLQPG